MSGEPNIAVARTMEWDNTVLYTITADGVDASVQIRHGLEPDILEDRFLSAIIDPNFTNWMLNALDNPESRISETDETAEPDADATTEGEN